MVFRLPAHPSGAVVDLNDERGNVVLLDVWATWCEPCREVLPLHQQFVARHRDRGLRAYAISIDEDLRHVDRFIAQAQLTLPVLHDRDAAVSENVLGIGEVPTVYLLDRKGVVRFVHRGFSIDALTTVEREVEQLLAEAP